MKLLPRRRPLRVAAVIAYGLVALVLLVVVFDRVDRLLPSNF